MCKLIPRRINSYVCSIPDKGTARNRHAVKIKIFRRICCDIDRFCKPYIAKFKIFNINRAVITVSRTVYLKTGNRVYSRTVNMTYLNLKAVNDRTVLTLNRQTFNGAYITGILIAG